MTEQIYIDGVLMEQDAGKTAVQLIYQSPILTEFDAVVSNRTTNVSLPLTQNNLQAIGWTGTQVDAAFPYRKHRVIYKRDGVQLIEGFATLLGMTDKTISFCFTWGNCKAMESLFETNLRDLTTFANVYVPYPPTLAYSAYYLNPKINYGQSRRGVGISVLRLLQAIESECGVSGLTPLAYVTDNQNVLAPMYVLPLTTRNGGVATRFYQKLDYGTNYSQFESLDLQVGTTKKFFIGLPVGGSADPHGYYNSTHTTFDLNGSQKCRIRFTGCMYVQVTYDADYSNPVTFVGLRLVLLTTDGNFSGNIQNSETIVTGELVSETEQDGYKYALYKIEGTSVYADIDVSEYNYMAVELVQAGYSTALGTTIGLSDSGGAAYISELTMEYDPNTPEDVVYNAGVGQNYPIGANLPDMTCGQLIKNLLWLHGAFAFTADGRTFQFATFSEVYAKRADALDWTDKMTTLRPADRSTLLDGTAQRNYFRYADADDYDSSHYEGVLLTDDETIDAEVEYCKSDFALCPDNKIPVWVTDDDGTITFEGGNVAPRLLVGKSGFEMLTAAYSSVQSWDSLLDANYAAYAAMIERPVVLKADFVLSTYDLNTLDMTLPIYLRQTGRYYLIRTLSVKDSKTAEAELIELR